ncbi:MAG: branched-chain amino acid ABC transporter permease [Micromonosporaceae bacterium]
MNERLRKLDQDRAALMRGMRSRWSGQQRWVRIAGVLALIAVLFYLPFLKHYPFAIIRTDLTDSGFDWSSVLFLIAVYVIVAIGLNVVVGLAGLLDLGYVGFFAVGAYSVALFGSPDSEVTAWIQQQFGLSSEWAVTWAACVPLAILLTMVSGVILGWPTLRVRGDYLAIVTLGFGEIIRIVARNSEFTGGPKGVYGIPKPPGTLANGDRMFGVVELYRWYWLVLVALLIFVFLIRRLEHSRVGRAWVAIREDEDAAAVMGVPAFKFKLWAFAIGAALGGFSGMMFASRQGFVAPENFLLNLSILFVAMVVLGGSGNMLGVTVGAILVTYLPYRFHAFEQWRPFAFAVALIIMMLLRPQGIIPSRRRVSELADRKKQAQEVGASG